eukprot:Skav232016  [mRNA]  locus=scaffold3320:70427:70973:- [translate_table: standard]
MGKAASREIEGFEDPEEDPKIKAADQQMPQESDAAPASARAPLGGPMGSGLIDLPFTPGRIQLDKCMARTWNHGKGGQCRLPPTGNSDFCKRHSQNSQWQVHGRVDGHVPPNKMGEFERFKKHTEVRKVCKK